jgi:hypothetical protein
MARTMAEGGKAQAALSAVRGKNSSAEARRAKADELAGQVAEGREGARAGEGEEGEGYKALRKLALWRVSG